MKLNKAVRLFVLPAALAISSLAAHADTFEWSLTGPAASLGGFPETGNGSLTANLTNGDWVVSSIAGTVGGSVITGLSSFAGADNQLFPGDTLLDTNGLSFSTADGDLFNIFSFFAPGSDITPGNNFGESVGGAGSGFGVGTFSLNENAPVPEPSTFLMLGTGLAGAATALRRKLFRA